jgi:23S rRNA pseudouridine1911/1915/1917 synthase
VNAEWTIAPDEAGVRLDKFLAAPTRLGSRSKAATALEKGKVFVNGDDASLADASRALTAGDVVRLWTDRPGSARRKLGAFVDGDLHVVYEDEAIVVVDKPAGLLSVPLERKGEYRSVVDLLERHLRSHQRTRPYVVHRIDRDTSGLVLFAKTAAAQSVLKAQFTQRQPERVYWAFAYGVPEPPSGTWRDRLKWDDKLLVQKAVGPRNPDGVEALSTFRLLEAFDGASWIEVRLTTGKRNQIRIQAALRGHPLVGEVRYVYDPVPSPAIPFARQALHAALLGFRHPTDARPLVFESPLPADLQGLLATLRRGRR